MNIAIIGTGNVGGSLAQSWAEAGHQITLGVRDLQNFKGQDLLAHANITASSIAEAAQQSEVILIAATPVATASVASALGDVKGKVIIDAMNSLRAKPEGYEHSFEALEALLPEADVVKCFNTTGFENMRNAQYGEEHADMFMAGDSDRAKEVATALAKDCGFETCWDFGGSAQAGLLEQLAFCWINLAIFQGNGRNIAFKVLTR